MPPRVPMRTATKPAPQPVEEVVQAEEVFEVTDEQVEELQQQEAFTPEEQEIVAEMSPEIELEEVPEFLGEVFQEGTQAEIYAITTILAEVRGSIDGLSVTLEELENRLATLITPSN